MAQSVSKINVSSYKAVPMTSVKGLNLITTSCGSLCDFTTATWSNAFEGRVGEKFFHRGKSGLERQRVRNRSEKLQGTETEADRLPGHTW